MKFLSQINVNTEYTLPMVDGTNGQVLSTDGAGVAYWGTISAGSLTLDGLSDVIITSPSSDQMLRYGLRQGDTIPVWHNFTPNFLTPSSSINALNDVVITTAAVGQILQYNGTAWINATLSTVEYVSKVQHTVKAGVAITKGQAVYVTGSNGTNMIVGLASNTSEGTSSKTMGLAASTAAINDNIFVVTEGLLAGLDTSTATAGDPVWLGTNGNLIFGLVNKPVAPAHLVYLGVVTRVQSNNGEIFVHVQNGFELHEIHDVLISSPSTGQLLQRASDGLWKNWTPNFLTAHPGILAASSVNNSNGTVIQDITLEANGHVTGLASVDLDTRYYTESEIDSFFGGETEIDGYNRGAWDVAYNDKINSASFSTTTGVLTLTQQDTGTITVDLDGRYLESLPAHTHTIANVTGLQTALDGKAESSHGHNDATTSASGFMSRADKDKLDGIASGANNYSLPTATSTVLGGIKVGTNLSISSGVLSATDTDTVTSVGIDGDLSTGNIELRGGGATTITKVGGTITITSTDTDTNTTYSAGTGLTLSGTTFSVTSGTYLTAEADTLATVTGRGNTTTNSISVGSISVPSRIDFTNAGVNNAFITESWGINLNGIITHPIQVRGASFSVGYTLGGGTSYGSGNMFVSGSVGIGTTEPGAKLHVVGNTISTGVIAETFWTNDSIRKLNAGASLNFRTSAGPIEMVLDGSGNFIVGGISANAANGAKIFGLKSESGKYFTQNAFGQDGGYTWPSTTYVTGNDNSPVGNVTFRGNGAFQGHTGPEYVPIDATKTYKVSVWIRSVSGSPYCYLSHRQYYWDYSNGNPTNGGWGNPYWWSGTPSSSWTEYSMTIGPSGSGAQYTHMAGVKFIRHGWLHNYTADGTATAEFQGWKIEELDSTLANNVTVLGNAYADSSFRAPIFYDSQDTAYYLDPNATSNILASYIGRVLINHDGTDTWFRMQSGNRMRITTTGGTDFIIPNTGEMSYNGNTVIHTGNIGSYALTSLPAHNHDDRYYTETESDSRFYLATNPNGYITGISFANVSSKPTTIAGYGITDAITTSNIGSQSVSFATSSGNSNLLKSLASYVWSSSTNGRDFQEGMQVSFVSSNEGYPEYGSVVRVHTYPNDGGSAELYFPYSEQYGGNSMQYRLGLYSNAGWSSWKTVIDSENIGSYALTSLPAHTHTIANVTGLQTALDSKLSAEADTLATVTGRGASTNTTLSLGGGFNVPDNITNYISRFQTNDYTTMFFFSRAWQDVQGANGLAYNFTTHTNSGSGGYGALQIYYGESGYVYAPTSFRSPSVYVNSAYINQKLAISSGDTWLRLNQSGEFTSGVYTPYLLRNDGQFINYGGVVGYNTIKSQKAQTDNNYTTAALWTESFDNTTTGIAFHISGNVGKFLEMRTNGVLYWENAQVWTAGTLTNLNQLTNGPGYITSSGNTSGYSGSLSADDNRTISPSEIGANQLKFGFTSWSNNNSAPYADYLHLRSYGDSSGGSDNLVMFKKSGIGMRIWQQNFGSGNAYSSYADVWTTGDFSSTDISNWNTAYGWGDHAAAGYLTSFSYTETDTLSSVTGRGGSTGSPVVMYGKVTLGNNSSGTYSGNTTGLTLNSTAEVRSTGVQNPPALTWHYEGLATRHLLMTSAGAFNFVSPSNEASGVAVVQVNGNTVWHAGNLTNLNQLTNGPGYITGYTETDTLSSVTGRGASTTNAITVGLLIAKGPGGNYDENIRLPGSTAVISFNTTGASGVGSYNIVSQTNFQIRNAGGAEVFVMNQSGDLTIGGTFTEQSSIRYKENVKSIPSVSRKVEQLDAVSYNKIGGRQEEIGLIAEDVAELFPEVVKYDDEGRPDGVNYSRLSVILLKAVQELTERVNKLENK